MFVELLILVPIWIRSHEGLTLETSASESLYGGQFTLINPVDKTKLYCNTPTDAAHHSFFRNLPPLIIGKPLQHQANVTTFMMLGSHWCSISECQQEFAKIGTY